MTQAGRAFYGWTVVAAAAWIFLIGFGSHNAFGALFTALQAEFGARRGEVALVYALTSGLYFALGAPSGLLAERIGARRVVAFGMALVGAGLVFSSLAGSLLQLYVTFSVGVGVGVGCAYVPALGTVQRWFVRRRGLASGFAVGGIGLGTLLMPPLASLIAASVNWRAACLAFGLLALIGGVSAAWLIVDRPEDRGLAPDGDDPATVHRATAAAGPAAPPRPLGDLVRSRPFRLLYLTGFFASFGAFIPTLHLSPYAQDHGLSAETGGLLLGLIGAGSTAGRFLLGGSADRLGRRRSLAGMCVLMGLALLWWLRATELWGLAAFAFAFGVGYGGFVALIPALTVDYLGARQASAVIGVLYTTFAFGTLIGPALAGYAFDLAGSYTLPIVLSAASNAGAVLCLAALGPAAAEPPARPRR